MALENFTDALIVYGPYDLSADHNEVKLEQKADFLDVTRFGHDTHVGMAGIRSLEVEGKGWVNFDDSTTPKAVDFNLFTEIGAAEKILTIAYAKADGSIAYLGKVAEDEYSPALKVGEVGTFGFKAKCAGYFCRGRLMLPLSLRSGASGTGTIYQLGAVSATQKVRLAIHVTEFTGTTLTMNLLSNDTNDTVSPTTRLTQAAITGVGSYYLELAGAISDTFWYTTWTFTGTNFKAAISAGIR